MYTVHAPSWILIAGGSVRPRSEMDSTKSFLFLPFYHLSLLPSMCDCDRLDCLQCGFRHCERLQRLPFARSGWASPPPEVKLEPVDLDDLPCREDDGFNHTLDHAPDTASASTSTSIPGFDLRPGHSSPPLPPQSLTGNTAEDPASILQDDEGPHEPRLYQRTAIKAVNDAFEDGVSRVGVSAPTGSGKTFIFAHVIREVLERNPNGKVMILVDSLEQANQAEDKVDRVCGKGNIKVSHERAGSRARNHSNV